METVSKVSCKIKWKRRVFDKRNRQKFEFFVFCNLQRRQAINDRFYIIYQWRCVSIGSLTVVHQKIENKLEKVHFGHPKVFIDLRWISHIRYESTQFVENIYGSSENVLGLNVCETFRRSFGYCGQETWHHWDFCKEKKRRKVETGIWAVKLAKRKGSENLNFLL